MEDIFKILPGLPLSVRSVPSSGRNACMREDDTFRESLNVHPDSLWMEILSGGSSFAWKHFQGDLEGLAWITATGATRLTSSCFFSLDSGTSAVASRPTWMPAQDTTLLREPNHVQQIDGFHLEVLML